ncbi:MAG: hypothetical protein KatS3mg094_077 [Candidatus Parcubacteria bacterium]|nr:MAG: hypothetical protein KatS3mg094_077 [Candidatus Parcubacteria bacterium]
MNLFNKIKFKYIFRLLFLLIIFIIIYLIIIIRIELPYEKLIPKIRKLIIVNKITEEGLDNLKIESEIDLTRDGIKEALVSLGFGGVAIDNYILITKKSFFNNILKIYNNVEILNFKTENGEIKKLVLSQGTGGGGKYGFFIKLLPEEGAIYQASYFAYNSSKDFCRVNYYRYNKFLDLFEYDKKLSEFKGKVYCYKLCQNIPQELKEYFKKICR